MFKAALGINGIRYSFQTLVAYGDFILSGNYDFIVTLPFFNTTVFASYPSIPVIEDRLHFFIF